ncbi:hypothetical protein [Phaeobacter sp. B1627]|uniref:hypothetical protein n=1 Tax=Phaeobacter sp. B1627 TaxID=2583809 RepID=UPI001117BEA6|nr:hypothetical protein [Phaeobacter sp. B1627]TNJ42327.1 hypothetical protein FGE21_11645 [Phaeobacter sp. B1627]
MKPTRIEGSDVRTLVREGAKRRTSFAFCMDAKNDPLLMIQPGNKPEQLRPHLKSGGGRPPMAWGTFVVRSDEMEMTCEQAPAKAIASLKRFLRANKPKVNVLFRDDGGNLLDSLKPEKASNDDGVTTLDEVNSTGIDPKLVQPLLARAKRIKPRIARAPGPLERKLKRGLSKSLAQINEGRLEEAQTLLTVIEQAVARIGADRESADASMKRSDRSRKTRTLGADVNRAKKLRASIVRAPGSKRSKLDRAVHVAARLLKHKDYDKARLVMDRIEKALGAIV